MIHVHAYMYMYACTHVMTCMMTCDDMYACDDIHVHVCHHTPNSNHFMTYNLITIATTKDIKYMYMLIGSFCQSYMYMYM